MRCTEMNLEAEQVRRLYSQGTIGLVGTIINGLFVVFIVGQRSHWETVLAWFLCLLAVAIIRFIDIKRFARIPAKNKDCALWRNRFVVLTLLSGMIWGSAGVLAAFNNAAPYYPFIAFIQGGLVAGTVGIYTIYLPAFAVFAVPALLPTVVVFFMEQTELGFAMASLVLLFLVLMAATARRLNRELTEGIRLQLERVSLVSDLKTEISERKTAQDELEKSKNQVEQQVSIRTAELNTAIKQLNDEILERRKAELSLKESERKFRELVENINDVIYVTDGMGALTFISPAVERLLGYQPEELMGRRLEELVHENDKSAVTGRFTHSKQDDTTPLLFRMLTKDGAIRWVQASNRPYVSDAQRVQIRGSLSDITDTKNLEARLQQAKKMEAIGRVAGGVAHDLNNILSGVVGFPDLLLNDLPPESKLRDPLTIIQKSGIRAANIVQDLLTLSRRGISEKEVVNLNDLIQDYLSASEFAVLANRSPNVRITKKLGSDLHGLKGSPVHLTKMIMNLVTNGVEAMPAGGELQIETANFRIDSAALHAHSISAGDYVLLKISDNGIGMSNDVKEQIFEPFFSKKVMGRSGSGLGMAVVWGTVEDHDGKIEVESEEGEGTCFTILFPATKEAPSAALRHSGIEEYVGHRESVLVVDDMPEQRELGSRFLSKLNYIVHTASSGEDAVAFLSKNSVDIVILDMIMSPGMDGLETYKQILTFHPGQKAIIASGFSETDRVKKAQKLGAGAFVQKPYTMETMGIAIRRELDANGKRKLSS